MYITTSKRQPGKQERERTKKMEYKNMRNPILPVNIHIPDGEAHVMPDGKLYLYGSFDDCENEYCSEKYHVISTADMENWTIHDVALQGQDIPWFHCPDAPKYQGIDWSDLTPFMKQIVEESKKNTDRKKEEQTEENQERTFLYAPDCIYKDSRYYLYFCMSDDSEGVAVSDKPQGPFENPVQLPCGGIDPAVFIDEDGQAYYYWGQLRSHGVKLNSDMVSFDPENTVDHLVTEEEHYFHEGSSVRKIGDTYYYVYADMERGRPTALGYATGKSPMGPFVYRGIIIDNANCDPQSWNNHGSIECVNGQWYVFYHRSSRGSKYHRRLCIEPIVINEDGTIPEVPMTSQGPGKPFGPGERIMAYQACEVHGSIYIDVDLKYKEKLTHIEDGDKAIFRYVKKEEDYQKIDMNCAGSGEIEVYFDGQLAGIVEVKNGVQISDKIYMKAGEYELCLKFRNVNKLEIMELGI